MEISQNFVAFSKYMNFKGTNFMATKNNSYILLMGIYLERKTASHCQSESKINIIDKS